MTQRKTGLVPKLRFPEFRDAGEWKEKKLGELAKKVTIKNKGSKVNHVLTNSAADGIVDQRDYFDKDIANKNNLDGYFIVNEGDYVYNPRISNIAPVGPISKNKIGLGVMSPLYTVFRFHRDNNDFYEHYFKSTHWYSYLREVSNSGARHDRMSITNDDFMDMPLPFPHPEEQQKIADCLSSLDELITAQSQKIDALKAHKKGLMQQLFPAEGETVPKLRFPEFRDVGEWPEKPLESICSSISSGKDKSDANGTYDLYGSTGVIGKTTSDTFAGSFILAARVGANAGLLTRATGKFGVTDNTLGGCRIIAYKN
ncbi:MAG: restriction endonuclease subunit S [Methylobacter sp.]|nr:restriction endonuclease subunit S [Methylobacter sp.]